MDPTKVVEYHLDLLKNYNSKRDKYSNSSSLLLGENVTNPSSSLSSTPTALSTSSLSSIRSSSASSTSRISSTSSASSISSLSSASLKGYGNGDGDTESINTIASNNIINNNSLSSNFNNERNNDTNNNNNKTNIDKSLSKTSTTPISYQSFTLHHTQPSPQKNLVNQPFHSHLSQPSPHYHNHRHHQQFNQMKKIYNKTNTNRNFSNSKINNINQQKLLKKTKNTNVYDILKKKTANCDAHAKFKDFSIDYILK